MEIRDGERRYGITVVPRDDWPRLRAAGERFYDYTTLTAINTCPTWGVLRYGLSKTEIPLSMGGRNTALECGSACHDFFSALRWWTLLQGETNYRYRMMGQFGEPRVMSMLSVPQDSDRVNNAQLFALDALHTSGYYDDPNDRRRTMANMESSCLVYADRYFKSDIPVYVKGDLVGIEIPFVIKVTSQHEHRHVYYCGRIDGVHTLGPGGALCIGENKTAARLSDTWRMAFAISHQVTGYMVAAAAIFNEPIDNAIVMGLQIPPPKDIFSGVSFELVTRTESDRIRWCEWIFHSVSVMKSYLQHPTEAPRYSHSCNRFFSACQFIPWCALERSEQVQALEDMRIDEWDPLHEKHNEGVSE